MILRSVLAALLALGWLAPSVGAEPLGELEARVAELEAGAAGEGGGWTRHIRLSGSSSSGWFHGERGSVLAEDSFRVWDARVFLDAELDESIAVGDRTLVRNIGFTLEWDLVRIGSLENQVGELYVDLQGIGRSSWLNFQVGRFQLPVGEGYLRYSRGTPDNPMITNPVGAPWFWDEGVRVYGSDSGSRVGYVASVSNAETPFNTSASGEPQGTLRLWWKPWRWLHLSVSGQLSGAIGSDGRPANGGLWLGESWAQAFGSFSPVANFVDGAEVADGPNRLDRSWLVGADAIAEPIEGLRLWLAWGRQILDSSGASLYDRELDYWVAEVVAEGGLVAPVLRPFYLALRAHGLTTRDDQRGYLLDVRYAGSFGYNMQSIEAWSAALGWRLGRTVTLRSEYTRQDIDLVQGVPASLRSLAAQADFFAIAFGVEF